MTIRKAFMMSMLLFLALSAGIGIFSILTGSFGDFQGKILLSTISLGAYSLTALCCTSILDRPKIGAFAALGIGISILGAAFALLTNWGMVTGWEIVLRGRFSLFVMAVSAAHVSLLMRITTEHSVVRMVRRWTIISIGVVTLLLLGFTAGLVTVLTGWPLLAISGILDVAGTIAIPILHATVKSPPGA